MDQNDFMDEEQIHPFEADIIQKRTTEAETKMLSGSQGKLVTIAKFLGNPIVFQGAASLGYDDPFYQDEELPVFTDELIEIEGYFYDGLSSGLHLEVRFAIFHNETIVKYKGYLVYKEVAGELHAYAPHPDWEAIIDRIYKTAKQRRDNYEAEVKGMIEQMGKMKVEKFLDKLKRLWGM